MTNFPSLFADLSLIRGSADLDPPEQVTGAAARDLPSTRGGGQDDVSSKQIP